MHFPRLHDREVQQQGSETKGFTLALSSLASEGQAMSQYSNLVPGGT